MFGEQILRFFIFTCLLLLSLQTFSLDLDRESIGVSYLNLPTHPMVNVADRNYSVLYNSAYHENEFQSVVEDNFHIDGFQKVYSQATVLIDFQFDEIMVTGTEVLSKNRKIKDGDGNYHTEYFYVPILKYKTNAQVFVTYANGQSKKYKFGSRSLKYTGEERYSTSEANRTLTNDLGRIVYDVYSQFVVEAVKDMDAKLTKKHGYKVIDTTDYLLVLDSRRYPEYKDYKRYYSLANRLFKQISAFESLDNIRQEIQVVINFLKHIPENYTNTKKADTKMRYASYYNLAKIYYYLDELNQAIFYYQKVIENDYHEGQSKRNIKDIEKLKDLFSVNQVNTRHFSVQLEQSSTPSGQNHGQNNFDYFDAEIQITDGELLEGKIELNSSIQDTIGELQYSEVINIKFLNDADEIESKAIYTEFIEFIQLEELKLQRISYATKPKNNAPIYSGKVSQGNLINVLAVELFSSNKISLYSFNNELILKKQQDTNGKSTSSTAFSFAFKKKLGKFFADCSSMQADIKSGAFKNNNEGLIQAVSTYTQCQK